MKTSELNILVTGGIPLGLLNKNVGALTEDGINVMEANEALRGEKMSKKIKSIMIIGKRWFDKVNGNTYCSSRVYINGELSFCVPWTYGYDDYYKQKAIEVMKEKGLIKLGTYENGVSHSFREYCDTNKINFESIVTDGLKRDMVAWGKE